MTLAFVQPSPEPVVGHLTVSAVWSPVVGLNLKGHVHVALGCYVVSVSCRHDGDHFVTFVGEEILLYGTEDKRACESEPEPGK